MGLDLDTKDAANELIEQFWKIRMDWVDNGHSFELLLGMIDLWKSLLIQEFRAALKDDDEEDGESEENT
jgi:hypothetical protein